MFMHKLTYLLSRFQSAKALISMIIAYLSLKDKNPAFFLQSKKRSSHVCESRGEDFFSLSHIDLPTSLSVG